MALWTAEQLDPFAWWQADSLDLDNDALVESWGDSTGNGYLVTAAGAARPQFKTNLLDGQPAIYFDGSTYLTSGVTNPWKFLHDSSGSTILAVWQAGTAADPNALYGLCGNNATGTTAVGISVLYNDLSAFSRNDAARAFITNGNSGQNVSNQNTANDLHPANTPVLLGHTGDPGNATAADRSSIFINGGSAIKNNTATDTASTGNPTYALQLGASGNNMNLLTGYIAEVAMWNRILSTEDRQKGEGYLAHKYGLAGDLPAGHPYKSAPPYAGSPWNYYAQL